VTSLILTTATRLLLPILLMFSLFLLLRGHNEPGGGFTGGLVAASGFALYALARGVGAARRLVRADTRIITVSGLAIALTSGIPALFTGRPFLTGVWSPAGFPGAGKVGTPLMFDVGVYLLVIGITLTILFTLAEEQQWKS
jgi:multicomponent Na+:H+ antiporter subunit B